MKISKALKLCLLKSKEKTQTKNFETVLIRGIFHFFGNSDSNFKGPIRQGFRPIVWIDSVSKATSCSFLFDDEILKGQEREINIVILNQLAFKK